ncbi:hypothetical protein D3C83_139920 [compost metagenome]
MHGADEVVRPGIEQDEMVAIVLGAIPERPRPDVADVLGREDAQRRLAELMRRQFSLRNDP